MMSPLFHRNLATLILFLLWTSESFFIKALDNSPYSGQNVGNFGSSFFYYQHAEYPRDCTEALDQCSTKNRSGVYLVKPDGYNDPFEVYCDKSVHTGGWTVIHRKLQEGYLQFNRQWTDYKEGFGFLSQEFWIGNDKLAFLTNQKTYELRIDLTYSNGLSLHFTYSNFRISDELGGYEVTSVGEYNGYEDEFNRFMCGPNGENMVYTSPDCTKRCSCTSDQYVCDNTYRCSSNAVCEERNNLLQCYCNNGYSGDGVNCTIDIPLSDCQDVYDRVSTKSGVYRINPTTWQGDPFEVYCNMTEGGGWTVFQRRVNGSEDFHLYWSDYKHGFGTPEHELWLGNDKLHSLTTQRSYQLRVDIVNSLGNPQFAKYSSFRINDENNNYRLSVGGYSGNAGESMIGGNNGQAFTTRDRDNDVDNYNCATLQLNSDYFCGSACRANSGWWYSNCGYAFLNAPYGSNCFNWNSRPGKRCNIKYSEMKIRPV